MRDPPAARSSAGEGRCGAGLSGEPPLDYQTELGVCMARRRSSGHPVSIDEAWQHIFGFCVLNDRSGRDSHVWEYQPLGPFP
ncbi:fumarylacetoacetate hydrolase family protein [Bradyrhizobium sp. S3.3.6]|uniref:fumarylacetoacetate hydrolase family protein n=1 Tax=Bradyrhizobium sp. S3.3.6 TaxID=3156429 RepID=UPI0033954326